MGLHARTHVVVVSTRIEHEWGTVHSPKVLTAAVSIAPSFNTLSTAMETSPEDRLRRLAAVVAETRGA